MISLHRHILAFEEVVGESLKESRKMLLKIREKWIFAKEKANLSSLEMYKMKNTLNELNDLAQEILSLTGTCGLDGALQPVCSLTAYSEVWQERGQRWRDCEA